jgi:tetratricopeptide (TPR) repeat protein
MGLFRSKLATQIKKADGNKEKMYNIARHYENISDYTNAIIWYEKIKEPDDFIRLGTKLNHSDKQLSLSLYIKAFQYGNTSLQLLGHIMTVDKVNELFWLIEISKHHPSYIKKVAEYYEKNNDIENAIEWYTKVPEKTGIDYCHIGSLYKKKIINENSANDLIQFYKAAVSENPNMDKISMVYTELAELCTAQNDHEVASEYYKLARQ